MAAFSYQHLPFLVDSVLFPLPSSPLVSHDITTPSIFDITTDNFNYAAVCLPYMDLDVENVIGDPRCGIIDGGLNEMFIEKEVSVAADQKQSTDSTSALRVDMDDSSSDQVGKGEDHGSSHVRKKRKANKRGSSSNSDNSKDGKARKGSKRQKKPQVELEKQKEVEEEEEEEEEEEARAPDQEAPTPTGYIHVRARRGQATDRHSLAERLRREKISERMKLLQALVPGCDKVIGKALMLDEIINYVQSLQYQVEFLSLKLASVEPMLYNIDTVTMEPQGFSCSLQPSIMTLMQQYSAPSTTSATASPPTPTTTTSMFVDSDFGNNIPAGSYLDEFEPALLISSLALLHQGHDQVPIEVPIQDSTSTAAAAAAATGSSFWEDVGDRRQSLSFAVESSALGGFLATQQ